MREIPAGFVLRWLPVNGHPGLVVYLADGNPQGVATFEVVDGKNRAIRLVVNPEKLEHVPPLSSSPGAE
jgi:RNA polymerase sigma-70 factor (ECF subfamily)